MERNSKSEEPTWTSSWERKSEGRGLRKESSLSGRKKRRSGDFFQVLMKKRMDISENVLERAFVLLNFNTPGFFWLIWELFMRGVVFFIVNEEI